MANFAILRIVSVYIHLILSTLCNQNQDWDSGKSGT